MRKSQWRRKVENRGDLSLYCRGVTNGQVSSPSMVGNASNSSWQPNGDQDTPRSANLSPALTTYLYWLELIMRARAQKLQVGQTIILDLNTCTGKHVCSNFT